VKASYRSQRGRFRSSVTTRRDACLEHRGEAPSKNHRREKLCSAAAAAFAALLALDQHSNNGVATNIHHLDLLLL